ncbi:MAG: hypothetical protein ACLSTJ_16705 [Clostridium neonatale]
MKIPKYEDDGIIYDIENNEISVDLEDINVKFEIEDIAQFKKIKREKSLYRYSYINELDHFFTYWLYKVIKPSKRMPSNLEPGLYLILLDAIDANNSEERSVMEFSKRSIE